MRTFFLGFITVLLAGSMVTPITAAAQHEKKKSDEPIVKRIFIRDGEVIEIDGGPEVRWVPDDVMTLGKHTYLGVNVVDLSQDLRSYFRTPGDRGVLISQVRDETPAAKAGLKAGDVIVSINGKTIDSSDKLRRVIREYEADSTVEVEIIRSGASQKIFATLGERGMRLPRIHLRDGDALRYRLEGSEDSLKKLNEFFESEAWKNRVMRIQDCAEIQEKLEEMQKRLNEMEKKLQKMK